MFRNLRINWEINSGKFLKLSGSLIIVATTIWAYNWRGRVDEIAESETWGTIRYSTEPLDPGASQEVLRERRREVEWNRLAETTEEALRILHRQSFISKYSECPIFFYATMFGGILVAIGECEGLLQRRAKT